jgi:hypothetical protein
MQVHPLCAVHSRRLRGQHTTAQHGTAQRSTRPPPHLTQKEKIRKMMPPGQPRYARAAGRPSTCVWCVRSSRTATVRGLTQRCFGVLYRALALSNSPLRRPWR